MIPVIDVRIQIIQKQNGGFISQTTVDEDKSRTTTSAYAMLNFELDVLKDRILDSNVPDVETYEEGGDDEGTDSY